jgi:transcriptional regulator with XRE-family HTH domain
MGSARPRPKLLASKLLTIRQELGLSQPQIAKRLGIKEYTNVSKYELDKNEPPLMILLAYARLAAIPVEYLIDDALDLPL